ncbi:hypothetical protein BC829DRAFT_396789 [Chytridium lagenaria]|nr:hypothetical protein BC829DRAFT_396789 [Chytridium lagenaria]
MFSSFLNRNAAVVALHIKGTDDVLSKQQVDRILTNLCPHLDKIGREKRSRLYDTMTYEFHPKGTILSRVGVTPESADPQFKYKSKACGVGSVIGIITDLEMMTEEAKFRREDVVLTSDSDFVRVRVDDYIRAIYSHDGGSVDQKVVLLNSFPFFAHATEDLLMTAVANCDIVHGSPNQVIVEEDEPYDRIYFVCKGSCIASKSVRFIKTSQRPQNNKSRKRSAIIPWVPGVSRQTTDEALDQKLEYVDVVKGRPLPKPIPSSNAKYVSLMTADTLRPLIVEPTPPISYVTITSSPNTGCTLLSMQAFLISVGYKDGGDMMATTDFRTVLKGLVERYKEMNYSPDSVPIEATKMVAEGLEGVEGVEEEVTVVAVEKPPPSPADVRSGPKASHMGLASYKIGSLS